MSQRNVVFLSYAMPEDTEFAVWLGIQLANNGYRVWSEATQLIGGERFWSDIEDVFERAVGRTIVVVSKVTRSKSGVLNEIERAEATATALGIPMSRFTLPVTVENISRQDMPIQVARQNAIAFGESWADGLAKLLRLLQKEEFPRVVEPTAVGRWVRDWYEGRHRVLEIPEALMTNAITVSRLPGHMRFYNLEIERDKLAGITKSLPFPCVVHYGLVLSFAAFDEMQSALSPDLPAKLRAEVPVEDFLLQRLQPTDPITPPKDARNHLTSMLRQAWDALCASRGMSKMELSSGHACWYFSAGSIEGDYVHFADFGREKIRRKKLYGVKTRRVEDGRRSIVMHWHYAPRAQFSVGDRSQLILQPHVAFTSDGRRLLGDPGRAHRIRRRFCKDWFNEQWRTLHLAYLSRLANGGGELMIPVSADQSFAIAPAPNSLTCPVTYTPPKPRRIARIDSEDAEPELVPDEDTSEGLMNEKSSDAVEDEEDPFEDGDWDEGIDEGTHD